MFIKKSIFPSSLISKNAEFIASTCVIWLKLESVDYKKYLLFETDKVEQSDPHAVLERIIVYP